jgi:hypothetical protein
LKQKFLDCWMYGGSKDEMAFAHVLYERLTHLEDLTSVRSLFSNPSSEV